MNSPVTNQITPNQLQPGTALRTLSTIFPVMHWGMVGYGRDSEGLPFVWHSQKSDRLRCTSYHEFCGAQPCDITWIPANRISSLCLNGDSKRHELDANDQAHCKWHVGRTPKLLM